MRPDKKIKSPIKKNATKINKKGLPTGKPFYGFKTVYLNRFMVPFFSMVLSSKPVAFTK